MSILYRDDKPKPPTFASLALAKPFFHNPWLGKDAADYAFLTCAKWAEHENVELYAAPAFWAFRLHWVAMCESEGRLLGDALNSNDVLQGRQQKAFVLAQFLIAKRASTLEIDPDIKGKWDLYQRWLSPGPAMHGETGNFLEIYNSPAAQLARAEASEQGRHLVPFEWFRNNRPDQDPEALHVVIAYARFVRAIPSHMGVPDFTISLADFVAKRPDLAKAKADQVVAERKGQDTAKESFAAFVARTGDITWEGYERSQSAGLKADL